MVLQKLPSLFQLANYKGVLRLNTKQLIVFGCLAAFYLGTSISLFVQWVSSSGHNLVNIQGADEYLIAIFWAFSLAGVLFTLRLPWLVRKHLLLLWGVRCLVTLIAMLFYESHYNLDAYAYYKNIMRQSFFGFTTLGDGTNFIISVGVFLDSFLPFGRSYHAFKVVWSFFGLLALIPLYSIYKELLNKEQDNVLVLWALGTFPSLIFWTSILGKDPLAVLGISCGAYGLLRLHKKVDLEGVVYTAAGILLMSFVRFWLVPIFLAPAIMSYAWGKSSSKIWRYAGIAICLAALAYLIDNLQAVLLITSTADAFESLNNVSSAWSRGGSGLEAPSFHSTSDVLKFLPLGFITAIFRPFPGEINNIFGILAGFESIISILIFVNAFRNMKFRFLSHPVIIYCWVVIFVWGCFYAFISYQNLGTAVRFRAQILPFIILLPFLIKSIKENPDYE